MISRINSANNNATFKAGYVHIAGGGDQHGKIMELPKVMRCIQNHAESIFPHTESRSTLNILALVGDWFINPSKKGFRTSPELTNGDLQKWALIKAIDSVKEIINNLTAGISQVQSSAMDVVYTLGNHCLDAGTDFALDIMKTVPMKTLITNVDLKNSDKIRTAMQESPNIVKSIVYSIPDDKKADLEHKVLFLGVTIPSMKYYNPGLCTGLNFFDDVEKKDSALKEEDIQGTINAVKEQVEAFKKENPKGAVFLMSHMGERLAKIIIENVPDINIVLSGHDHRTTQIPVGNSTIISLGKDNEVIKSVLCKFDDDGNFIMPTTNQYNVGDTVSDGIEESDMARSINARFAKDTIPLIKIIDSSSGKAQRTSDLEYGDTIRYYNSYLMNFLTTTIKEQLNKTFDENIDIVGIQSSIVRGGIENDGDNLSVLKVFDGVSEELSGIQAGYVTGEDLVGLITENVRDNDKDPDRNTLIHWSDIQLKFNGQILNAIRVRNPITNDFEPIDPSKKYKIAIGKKYLMKNSIEYPPKIRESFHDLNTTYNDTLGAYLEDCNYTVQITDTIRENRVHGRVLPRKD